jgi:cell division septation protein DedD
MPEKEKAKKSFELKQHGTTIWIGMIVFSSAWMFVLGIFVGRGTAPVKFDIEKLQKELIALKETVIKEEQKRFKLYLEAAQKKTNLGFYEALKETKSGAGLQTEIPKQTKKRASKKVVTKRITPKSTQKPRSQKTAAAKETSDDKIADSGKTEDSEKNLTIQIASLREVKSADELVAKLKKRGYRAYRTIGKIPGKGVWYRVRVGYYKNKVDAESTLKQLKRDKLAAYLVKW